MSVSLYDALVPTWIQLLDAMSRLIDKAETHCKQRKLAPEGLIDSRLAPDMYPLGYQIKSTVVHSIGSIEAARQGTFSPDRSPWPVSFTALHEQLKSAINRLSAIDEGEVNALAGRDFQFEAGSYKANFLAEDFLLSFAQPNFFFHCTIAYGILRAEGVAIGKLDFLGKMRHKP